MFYDKINVNVNICAIICIFAINIYLWYEVTLAPGGGFPPSTATQVPHTMPASYKIGLFNLITDCKRHKKGNRLKFCQNNVSRGKYSLLFNKIVTYFFKALFLSEFNLIFHVKATFLFTF